MRTIKFRAGFTREEQTLLRRLKSIEEGARLVRGALTVGVFKELVVGGAVAGVYSIYDTDWDLFVTAVGAIEKTVLCKCEEAINFYLLENHNTWPNTEGTKVLKAMLAVYSGGCK